MPDGFVRDVGGLRTPAAMVPLQSQDLREELSSGPAPRTGSVRAARAVVLGGLSLLLATGAHLLGGGALPGIGVLLVAATVLGLIAAVVTARRCRFGLLAVLLAGEQLALHELFDVASAARACTLPAGTGHGMHAAHLAGAAHAASSCPAGGTMTMSTGPAGALMWVAHLAAAVATAWLLARGEAWLWRVVERVVAAAGLAATGRGPLGRRGPQSVSGSAGAWSSLAWRPAAPRGPPLSIAD